MNPLQMANFSKLLAMLFLLFLVHDSNPSDLKIYKEVNVSSLAEVSYKELYRGLLTSTTMTTTSNANMISRKSLGIKRSKYNSTNISEKLLWSMHGKLLKEIQTSEIYNKENKVCELCYEYNTRTLLNQHWRNFTGNAPIMVILSDLHHGQTGNIFGSLLSSIGCANMSGAHVIHLNLNKEPYQQDEKTLFESIPKIIINKNPAVNITTVIHKYIENGCVLESAFPWEEKLPLKQANGMIYSFHTIVRKSINAQMKSAGFFKKYSTTLLHYNLYTELYESHNWQGTDIPNLANMLSNIEISKLPKYPDVAVHYRCSDNLLVPGMGLLAFHHIKKLIPSHVKYIFILTEDRDYNRHLCRPILDALHNDIQSKYPNAYVVLRRGGYKIEILAMLMHSRITICSLSTFCFFFATSNKLGQVYIPSRHYFRRNNWYGQKIELNNIHTLNNTSICSWFWLNGTRIMKDEDLTAEIMIRTLRDEKYEYEFDPWKE